jgi:toxin-antitoxin system, toxin component, relE family
MLAMNLEKFGNDDLKRNLKKIVEDKEELILIANEEKDTVVILSLEKYNQLIKDIENAKYLAKLDLAYEQMMINKKMDEEIEKKKNLNRNKSFGIGD